MYLQQPSAGLPVGTTEPVELLLKPFGVVVTALVCHAEQSSSAVLYKKNTIAIFVLRACGTCVYMYVYFSISKKKKRNVHFNYVWGTWSCHEMFLATSCQYIVEQMCTYYSHEIGWQLLDFLTAPEVGSCWWLLYWVLLLFQMLHCLLLLSH